MTFLINNTDLANDLVEDTLRIQSRCDEGFANGSCTIYTSLIAKNIPPYTLCSIDGTLYFISSEATEDMQNAGYWNHDCTILELTAILQCFILGTKTFSASGNHQDTSKIQMICDLMKDKYQLSITNQLSDLTQNHEFFFGAGTTMFQALTEILSWYNYRPLVTSVSISQYGNYQITLSKITLNGNTTYSLSNDRLISKVYRQNVDDYGAILESEMNNVVDRTNTTTFKDLTARSESSLYNADTAIIKLPCKVEKITNFSISAASASTIVSIANFNYSNFGNYTGNYNGWQNSSGIKYIVDTYGSWKQRTAFRYSYDSEQDSGEGYNVANFLWNEYFSNVYANMQTDFMNQKWILYMLNTGGTAYFKPFDESKTPSSQINVGGALSQERGTISISMPFDMTNSIMEKTKWETLEAKEQSKYAVYDKGGDTIYNLNATYKDDLWGLLLGQYQGNFLDNYPAYEETVSYNDDPNLILSVTLNFYQRGSINNDPTYPSYNVTCIPSTNPIIVDEEFMNSRQVNEVKHKRLAKSYQNSASVISFDNVINNIHKTNGMLGQPEIELEYDTTDVALPNITDKITIDGFNYYVMSITTEYHNDWRTSYINLCSSYSKIADVIGVESQYNSTRLPVNEVVERPVYIPTNVTISESVISNKTLYVYFKLYNSTGYKEFFMRPAIMKQGNKIYFYVEFEDNYSAGKHIDDGNGWDTNSSNYNENNKESLDSPYGDLNNEVTYGNIALFSASFNKDNSYKLPICTSSMLSDQNVIDLVDFYHNDLVGEDTDVYQIHKDAREKLTFTIICDYTN